MQDFGYLDYSLKVVDTEKRIRKEGRTEGRKDGWEEGLVPPGTSYLLCERKEERCQRIFESSG